MILKQSQILQLLQINFMITDNTLYRKDGLTSDGQFMIKTELEPKILQRKATAEVNPNLHDHFTRIIATAEVSLTIEAYENPDTTLKLWKLTSDKKATYIQKRFLSYFGSKKDLAFYQDRSNVYTNQYINPIVIKRKGEVLGIIMPVRMSA